MIKFSEWMRRNFECTIRPKEAYDEIDKEVENRIKAKIRKLFSDMGAYMSEYHITEEAIEDFRKHWLNDEKLGGD